MALSKKTFPKAAAAAAAFDPLQNFETVTYTGNGSTQKITGYIRKGAAGFAYNKYITFPDMGGFTSNTSDADGALSIWFSLNSIPASNSDYYTLIDRGNPSSYSSTYQALELLVFGTSNTNEVTFNFRRGFSGTNYDPTSYSATATTLSANTWYHLVVSYVASTKTATFYLDGTSIGSYSLTSAAGGRTIDSGFNIGSYANSSSYSAYAWNGKIDQFRIFNKALSSGEVTTLYGETYASSTKSTTDIFGDGSGVALYELDEDANDTGGTYNGTPTNINFLGMAFQPDLVWIKDRGVTGANHVLSDSVRGATRFIISNATDSQYTSATGTLSSFDSNGFSLSVPSPAYDFNINGNSYVAWCFKGGGAAVSNTDGSITSQVSANQAAGFSIVKYTANGIQGATIGHGLSSAPEMIIVKALSTQSTNNNWAIYHSALGNNYFMYFTTDAAFETPVFPSVSSSTISLRSSNVVNTSGDYIAYCFHSVDGYQKVGSYIGTGASGNAITTGFQPRFVMIKSTTTSPTSWVMIDHLRDNADEWLYANESSATFDDANTYTELNSNGFTVNLTASYVNASGHTYIYLAIA
jgi:hypothetical protein